MMLTAKEYKEIEPGLRYLEEYDRLGTYPNRKKKITLTLSNKAVDRLRKEDNMSKFVEKLLLDVKIEL